MTIACANYDREGTRKEKDNEGWVVVRPNRCLGILQEALTLEDTEYKNTSWVGGTLGWQGEYLAAAPPKWGVE